MHIPAEPHTPPARPSLAGRCTRRAPTFKRQPTCWPPACTEPPTASTAAAATRKLWVGGPGVCEGLRGRRAKRGWNAPKCVVNIQPATCPPAGTLRVLEERWQLLGTLCPVINSSWGENEARAGRGVDAQGQDAGAAGVFCVCWVHSQGRREWTRADPQRRSSRLPPPSLEPPLPAGAHFRHARRHPVQPGHTGEAGGGYG